ncbi:apolipoprotein N-acyltransferase [Geomonas propionica]|uniref:Apolipoprotein N-acyltransferase n=1 Tax=Geomonas propionica TaxID=2798582 RepID=A0ABS0YXE8_9BACT|nr:apolipoprotein N-acyltransferase [Geomonas propionica]MBJ6802650.1 apolipoprotein N-acyltransferase [Geomonas propionica]
MTARTAIAGEATAGRYLLALLSGVLLALSFPLPGVSALAWVAFAPLLLAADRVSPRLAFRLGFTAGCVAYAGILYWLNVVMMNYGKLHWTVSVTLYLVLVGYLALYPGAVLWLVRRCEASRIPLLCSFPLLWVTGEAIRSYVLTGFPWASLGYSQYRTLPLIQISDLTGVYGVSFLIALANVVVYRIWVSMRYRKPYPVRALLLLVLLMAATMVYGVAALTRSDKGEVRRVLLVQGNIPQDRKWDPAFQDATLKTYERLTREGNPEPGTLVVWPESALPFFLQQEPAFAARVSALAVELKSPLVVGSPAYELREGRARYLNSAFLISEQGGIAGRSDKLHLVPFGEYVPLAPLLPFVNKLVTGIGDFSPGKQAVVLPSSVGKLGVLVCFEGIFPEVANAYVEKGAQVLVNITNDAWFGRSSAPYQHLSMTVFRAVENRVPLVRAANTGISSVIDSKGHIRGMTQLFQEATLSGEVRPGTGRTFYNRFGDLFALICLAGSIGMGIACYRGRRY